MRRFDSFLFPGILVVLLLAAAPASAGDSICKSTQAANDLRSCCICREVKRILSDPALEGATFEVTRLKLGATVRMESESEEGRILLQDFVSKMWGNSPVDEGDVLCDYCRKRRESLQHVLVDWTSTERGLELVLISEDPQFAKWAAHDAQETQGWVLSSSGY